MSNIKLFNNHASFEREKAQLDLPYVVLCNSEYEVHYGGEYETVDLGLPSGNLWSTKNVGAIDETDSGLYFAWGETSGYTKENVTGSVKTKAFTWGDYKYGGNDSGGQTKYNTTDGLTALTPSDDAATANIGIEWRMPSEADFRELISSSNTLSTYVTNYKNSGVNGRLIISKKNGNKIFFPICGSLANSAVTFPQNGYYYGTTLDVVEMNQAVSLQIYPNENSEIDWSYRFSGCNVRAIKGEPNIETLGLYMDSYDPNKAYGDHDLAYQIAHPNECGANYFVYSGETVEFGGTTCYVWRGVATDSFPGGDDANNYFLLTDTNDYSTLYGKSLAASQSNINTPFDFVKFTCDGDASFYTADDNENEQYPRVIVDVKKL